MFEPLLSAKEGDDTVPILTRTTVGTERKMELGGVRALGARLGLEKETPASGSQASSGSAFGGSLKRLSLGKAQLEVGWTCSLKGGETLISSPRERLHDRCPSFPSTATGSSQDTDPYAYF